MENRNYILDRLKSKTMTIDEFNYDALQAPPISYMFTPTDIGDLHSIASSIKYSAKPHIRFQEIDRIMRSRGFVKFISGTNRIAYTCPDISSIIAKVAIDNVGLGDNPRDFQNQFIFKPFITKVFETTPDGSLALFERVTPITSREEFLSVAGDIYEVLNNWFIGEYILEDIGTKCFMNWGVRKGFGPVLLDFPYVYKLDGNKLFCNAPSAFTPSGKCEGVIDYDPGFNYLHCTKCGVKYRARELEAAIKENNVIIKSQGGFKMKISISGGSKEVDKTVVTGEYAGEVKSIPTKANTAKSVKTETNTVKKEISEKVNETIKSEETATKEEKVEVKNNEATKVESKVLSSPIFFDNSIVKEKNDEIKIEKFNRLLQDALDVFITSSGDDKKAMNDAIVEAFKDQILEAIGYNETEEETIDTTGYDIRREIDDIVNEEQDDIIDYFMEALQNSRYDMQVRNVRLSRDEDGHLVASILPVLVKYSDDEEESELCVRLVGDVKALVEESSEYENENKVIDSDEPAIYNDIKYYPAKTINMNEILHDFDSYKAIVIVDENGNYLTIDNTIIAIDVIDDRNVGSIAIVPNEWREGVLRERAKESENTNGELSELNYSSTPHILPTGMLPPDMSINGVPVDKE